MALFACGVPAGAGDPAGEERDPLAAGVSAGEERERGPGPTARLKRLLPSISCMVMQEHRDNNIRICRRQSGPQEPALGLPGSATTLTGRYTTPRPSGKLHPQAVGGADGRYGESPEGQTVTPAVPPFGVPGAGLSGAVGVAQKWSSLSPWPGALPQACRSAAGRFCGLRFPSVSAQGSTIA